MWPCKCPWLNLSQWWIWQRENSKKTNPKEVPQVITILHYLQISQLEQALHGSKQGQHQKTFLSPERTANSTHTYIYPHNKSWGTAPWNRYPPCCCGTKADKREMWMGTKLYHLEKHRGGLEWWFVRPTTTKCSVAPAEHPMHSITRHTTTTTEEYPMSPGPKSPAATGHTPFPATRLPAPPATKLPALWVTILWYTRLIHRADPSKKRVGRENGETKWQIWPRLLLEFWIWVRLGRGAKYKTLVWRLLNSFHSNILG